FDDTLLARPDIAWKGGSGTVIFTVPISLYPNFIASTVTLLEVDAEGNTLSDLGKMVDNGQTGSTGDEIQSDGVFTKKASVACGTQDARYYRAAVQVTQMDGATSYTAYTPIIPVWCVEHLTPAVCQGHQQVIQQAEQQAQSGVSAADVVGTLLTNPQVSAAGVAEDDGHSIWIQFTSGVLGAVLLAPEGLRGSGDGEFLPADPSDFEPLAFGGNTVDIGSKKAVVLAPFSNEFASGDDGPEVATILATSECPSFNVEGGSALQQADANLNRFRDLSLYGVASISTHGEALFGSLDALEKVTKYHWAHQGAQEVIWTGEQVQCGQLLQTNKSCTINSSNPTGGCPAGTVCQVTQGSGGSNASGVCIDRTQADLRMGNVVITNKGYAVTPAFFERYAGRGY
ncbi:MAG: hypothetical protein VX938_12475, partial [Myxococcota bacterium]|nr:hypothetical protein [Myxococcota bacterium]